MLQAAYPTTKEKAKEIFSGKKSIILLKTEIVMQDTGQILAVSETSPGRKHDFRIRKEGKSLPNNSEKFVDSGYQGLQKIAKNVT
jgi:hypothetical protein